MQEDNQEEITITQRDLLNTENPVNIDRRREFLKRVDSFIRTASVEEISHIRKVTDSRSVALGISSPATDSKIADRILARFAVELVPILLTMIVVIPIVLWVVMRVMQSHFFPPITAGCPPICEPDALLLWAVVSGVGFLLIILAYYGVRKLMIRWRTKN